MSIIKTFVSLLQFTYISLLVVIGGYLSWGTTVAALLVTDWTLWPISFWGWAWMIAAVVLWNIVIHDIIHKSRGHIWSMSILGWIFMPFLFALVAANITEIFTQLYLGLLGILVIIHIILAMLIIRKPLPVMPIDLYSWGFAIRRSSKLLHHKAFQYIRRSALILCILVSAVLNMMPVLEWVFGNIFILIPNTMIQNSLVLSNLFESVSKVLEVLVGSQR